jgi:hypothetical protein
MGYYNYCVCASPFELPYVKYDTTRTLYPNFVWALQPGADSKPVVTAVQKVVRQVLFYLSITWIVPLIPLLQAKSGRWIRFASSSCFLMLLATLLTTGAFPHYTAPTTSLVFLLIVQGLRRLQFWWWRNRPCGWTLVRLLLLVPLGSLLVLSMVPQRQYQSSDWSVQRAQILTQLSEDDKLHLIIVRTKSGPAPHAWWVYNLADIDNSKVIWARELDPERNRTLLEYFNNRCVWLLDTEIKPLRLVPY